MKLFLGLFLCITFKVFALMPCEIIGYDRIANNITPINEKIITKDRSIKQKIILKRCINNYSVCLVENFPKNRIWVNKQFAIPNNNIPFNEKDKLPHLYQDELRFALLQYVDPKTKSLVCIAIRNSFCRADPWYGASWVIDGQSATQYEIRYYGDSFSSPKKLFKVMLNTHKENVAHHESMGVFNVLRPDFVANMKNMFTDLHINPRIMPITDNVH